MASDSWIAASMRQSDAEIDTIAARPKPNSWVRPLAPHGEGELSGGRGAPLDREGEPSTSEDALISFVVDLAQERDRHRAGADFRNAVTSEAPQLEVPEGCATARVMAMCVGTVANVVV